MTNSTSKNASQYKGARASLLIVIICSLVNIFTIALIETYFVFSSYISQIIIIIGYSLDEMLIYGVIAAITIVPYLLCWIFSKKHPGWLVASLVLFSIDSVLFLIDLPAYLAEGDYTMFIDLAVRVYVIITLVLGVKAGFSKKKDLTAAVQEAYANQDSTEEEGEFEATREITVTRKKTFIAMAAQMIVCINNQEVCRLKSGESQTLTVPTKAFVLGAVFTMGGGTGEIIVPEVATSNTYKLSPKMGFTVANIEITPV
ncbi:MAG: hypothetical protein E7370_02155 [Clostridiales bacterium]|nr:hypothetical protein [Clostridiales bacterium]